MRPEVDPVATTQMAANGTVPVVLLVEMLLTAPLRMCSSFYEIEHDGNTYLPLGDLGSVEEVEDGQGDYKPLRYSLSGVRQDLLVIALEENIRNKPCTVFLAVLDEVTHQKREVQQVWTGTLDQMGVAIDPKSGTAVISVTAEHRAVTYARPKSLRYTDADQRRLYPTDTSLRFIESQANHTDVWPAASFGRQ